MASALQSQPKTKLPWTHMSMCQLLNWCWDVSRLHKCKVEGLAKALADTQGRPHIPKSSRPNWETWAKMKNMSGLSPGEDIKTNTICIKLLHLLRVYTCTFCSSVGEIFNCIEQLQLSSLQVKFLIKNCSHQTMECMTFKQLNVSTMLGIQVESKMFWSCSVWRFMF